MAGAGYKLFQTGDVLTAAQVNTYLNEQTVMVFANAAARTSALTSVLAEGMVSYLQDTNAVEVYNGSAWVGVSGAGGVTEVQAGTGISVASGTGPIPVVTNTMATAVDAKGDLIVGTGADTFARLAVGTNGHTLVADSSTATGLAYAAPAGSSASYTLINAGGTALTGAATITVSGISGYERFIVLVISASSATAGVDIRLRINADSGANQYDWAGGIIFGSNTYSKDSYDRTIGAANYFPISGMSGSAGSAVSGGIYIDGGKSTGTKSLQLNAGATADGSNGHSLTFATGIYKGSATISSISVVTGAGNFDAGTIFVYGSAN